MSSASRLPVSSISVRRYPVPECPPYTSRRREEEGENYELVPGRHCVALKRSSAPISTVSGSTTRLLLAHVCPDVFALSSCLTAAAPSPAAVFTPLRHPSAWRPPPSSGARHRRARLDEDSTTDAPARPTLRLIGDIHGTTHPRASPGAALARRNRASGLHPAP